MTKSDRSDRIQAVLASFDDMSVRAETIKVFLDFLKKNLSLPCEVVTAGEFEKYHLDDIEDSNDDLFGLLGNVRLQSNENVQTKIPLCDLKPVDNRSKNFELLSDYADWFVNHQ